MDPDPTDFLITTTLLNFATIGMEYSETLEAINGVEPLTWEITEGALPPGLSLGEETGIISGVATELGSFFFTIQVTDSTDEPQVTSADLGMAAASENLGTAIGISVSSLFLQGNAKSALAAVNADGRYVAFASLATNLVSDDTNNAWDIFVRDTCRDLDVDTCTPFTVRVSVATDGAEADSDSLPVQLSGGGRYAVFASLATNLVAGDTNNAWDIFIRDTCIGEDPDLCTPFTERVSVGVNGFEAQSDSVEPSVSADGRFIAFRSLANNLVPGDSNGAGDIFVRDTCLGQDPAQCAPATVRVSVSTSGTEATGNSLRPSISPDGRFVAFESLAANLVPGDTNGTFDIFVRDACLGAGPGCAPRTLRASLADGGAEMTGAASFRASVSSGGRYVTFDSSAANLVAGDTNGLSDVFVRDTCLGALLDCVPATTRVSLDENDAEFDASSTDASISGDGRVIAFRTTPVGLAPADPNSASEIYVRDTCLGENPVVCAPATLLATLASNGTRIDRDALSPALSEDGTAVLFQSASENLASGDSNFREDVFFLNLLDFLTR